MQIIPERLTKPAGTYDIYKNRTPKYTKDQVFSAVEWLLRELDDKRIWEYCPAAEENKIVKDKLMIKIRDAFPDIYPGGVLKVLK
jgi:hypothetical protein